MAKAILTLSFILAISGSATAENKGAPDSVSGELPVSTIALKGHEAFSMAHLPYAWPPLPSEEYRTSLYFIAADAGENTGHALPGYGAIARYKLGERYEHGIGIEQDTAKAVKWYMQAAEAGLPVALFRMGLAFERGEGVKKDLAEALSCYAKMPESNRSLSKRGIFHLDGRGIEKDRAKGREYLIKAMKFSQSHLSNRPVENAVQLKERYVLISPLYRWALMQIGEEWHDNEEWQKNLFGAELNAMRTSAILERELSTDTFLKECSRSDELKKYMAAEEAWNEYVTGHVPSDAFRGIRIFKQIADRNKDDGPPGEKKIIAAAQYRLARLYDCGIVTSINRKEAAKYYRKALDNGCLPAGYKLGWLYETGDCGEHNDQKAYDLYERTKEHPGSLYRLGVLYHEGRGVKKNNEKAIELWEKAVGKLADFPWPPDGEDYIPLFYRLGIMYDRGWGVTQDSDKAGKQYEQAERREERILLYLDGLDMKLGWEARMD